MALLKVQQDLENRIKPSVVRGVLAPEIKLGVTLDFGGSAMTTRVGSVSGVNSNISAKVKESIKRKE